MQAATMPAIGVRLVIRLGAKGLGRSPSSPGRFRTWRRASKPMAPSAWKARETVATDMPRSRATSRTVTRGFRPAVVDLALIASSKLLTCGIEANSLGRNCKRSQRTFSEEAAERMTPDPTAADLPMVDAHVHFWDPTKHYYPWLNDEPMIPFRYGDYSAILRPYYPAEHLADARSHGHNIVKTG